MIMYTKFLWNYLTRRRKKQFLLIFTLMIVTALTEIISIGAIFPFLSMLTAPNSVYESELMQPIIHMLGVSSAEQLLLPLTIGFIVSVLIAGIARVSLLYVMNRFEQVIGSDLSVDVYRRLLYQDYIVHINRNSSDIISSITGKVDGVVNGVISPILELISSILILISIMTVLMFIDLKIALGSLSIFGMIYWVINRYMYQRITINSRHISDQSTATIKILQEGIGGIRDVLIDGSQKFYCKVFQRADVLLRQSIANNNFIAYAPRFILEALGLILIAGLAYYMNQLNKDGAMSTIPVLGALAMGAQRLLPALQKIYSSITTISGSYYSFKDVLHLLNYQIPNYIDRSTPVPITFKNEIHLNNIGFRYTKSTPWVLNNVNLTFKKGSRIGFMGETGSGKSTLLDIVMGLLKPTDGRILVDGQVITAENNRSWQAHISHVPQSIYLSDGTIEQNIALGVLTKDIDRDLVKKVAKWAKVSEFIDSCPKKYQTIVGERGVRISGGQRQRIGIARALYKNTDILIFDEATSALDSKTEKMVMESIEALSKELTIFIIAHRKTTLESCDLIVELNKNCNINFLEVN